jgi:hypothetical protein
MFMVREDGSRVGNQELERHEEADQEHEEPDQEHEEPDQELVHVGDQKLCQSWLTRSVCFLSEKYF